VADRRGVEPVAPLERRHRHAGGVIAGADSADAVRVPRVCVQFLNGGGIAALAAPGTATASMAATRAAVLARAMVAMLSHPSRA
jgi:hypothetical protein